MYGILLFYTYYDSYYSGMIICYYIMCIQNGTRGINII